MTPPIKPTRAANALRAGDRVTLVAHSGSEYPVEIVGVPSLDCDLVVRWLGLMPLAGLSQVDGCSTVCTKQLREVRRV